MPVFPGESCYLQLAVCIFASQSELRHLQGMVSVCVCVHMIYRVNCSILERWGNPVCYFEIRQPQTAEESASQPATDSRKIHQPASHKQAESASQPAAVSSPKSANQPATDSRKIRPPASQPQTVLERLCASFVVYGSTGTCFCKLCSIR